MSRLLLALCAFACIACATDLREQSEQVDLRKFDGEQVNLRITREIELSPVTGRCRNDISANSEWRPAGYLDEGTVYRPTRDVLTVETGNSYEAWIVVAEATIVGLYLPVEHQFLDLTQSVSLTKE